ncbi:MAG: BamA/TamA family outer membrane protein [Pseudomonadota bacterium]
MFIAAISTALAQDASFRVSRVRFAGVEVIQKKELIETLSTNIPSRYKFWMEKPLLTEEDLVEDIERIRQFYQAHGYYHIQAGYVIKKIKDIPPKAAEGKPDEASRGSQLTPLWPGFEAEVLFTITEGPPTLIKSIEITMDATAIDIREEDLRANLPIEKGRLFDSQKYRESKSAIERELGNRGYPFCKVTGNVVVDMRSNTAAVSFEIVPGEKSRFGDLVIIQKESPVKEALIHRALTFTPGEVFEARKIEQSQRNLYNLDVFKSAVIQTENPLPGTDTVPMRLEAKPKKRQSIRFGVGYGSEDGFRVKSGWTFRNIGGWAGLLSMNAKRSDIYEGISGDYTQPYTLDAWNQFRVESGMEKETLESYDNLKTYSNVSLTRRFRKDWDLIIKYNLEINRLEGLNVTDPDELLAFKKDHNYWVSSVAWGAAQNTTDNDISPTKGHFFSFSVEVASALFGSSLSFIRPDLEVKRYHPIAFDGILAGRLRLQSLREIGDTDYIPIIKRLFLGGANTVRGYGYQKLGLLDDTGNPLGGQSAMNANLEVRRHIYDAVSGVLFLDMGMLSEKALHFDMSRIRYTGGIGLRYDTLVGPIRVDWGYKLNPGSGESDPWQLHFSVGQAF